MIQPQYRTVQRFNFKLPPVADCGRPGECPSCSREVEHGDPITYISEEWVCGLCGGV